jgi:hypothetical protein
MAAFMDIVMSAFVFAILALTIGRVQVNINNTKAQNQFSYSVQTNSVELARNFIERDFAKIGYHVTGQKITAADSTAITFMTDLENTSVVVPVRYSIGTPSELTATSNPRDFLLRRTVNGNTTNINFGLVLFKLKYYDSNNGLIPTPITTAAQLNNIRGIRICFDVQSIETVPSDRDSTWEAVSWEKTILPRNLSNLNY